jgi:hypothetical protein
MKFLAIVLILIGFAYAWFSWYEPVPRGRTMQGTVQQFCEALHRRDRAGMRRVCSDAARGSIDSILEDIAEREESLETTLTTVNPDAYEFSATRGATVIDGHVAAIDNRGATLWSGMIRVERMREGDEWHITLIR